MIRFYSWVTYCGNLGTSYHFAGIRRGGGEVADGAMTELDHSWVGIPPAGKSEEGAGSGVEELHISDLLDLDQFQSLLANF